MTGDTLQPPGGCTWTLTERSSTTRRTRSYELVLHGEITSEAAEAIIARLRAIGDEGFFRILVDYSRVSGIALSNAALLTLASSVLGQIECIAVVAPADYIFGLNRQVTTYANIVERAGVFRERWEAERWLDGFAALPGAA